MYGIFTYIYHKNQANVGKYTSPMDPQGYICFIFAISLNIPIILFHAMEGWKLTDFHEWTLKGWSYYWNELSRILLNIYGAVKFGEKMDLSFANLRSLKWVGNPFANYSASLSFIIFQWPVCMLFAS